MGKASRSKLQRASIAPDIWYVATTHTDDSGELRAIRSCRQARALFDELTAFKEQEPGLRSVDLVDFAGRPLLVPEADGVMHDYISVFARHPRGPRAGKWQLVWPNGENAAPEFLFDDGAAARC